MRFGCRQIDFQIGAVQATTVWASHWIGATQATESFWIGTTQAMSVLLEHRVGATRATSVWLGTSDRSYAGHERLVGTSDRGDASNERERNHWIRATQDMSDWWEHLIGVTKIWVKHRIGATQVTSVWLGSSDRSDARHERVWNHRIGTTQGMSLVGSIELQASCWNIGSGRQKSAWNIGSEQRKLQASCWNIGSGQRNA